MMMHEHLHSDLYDWEADRPITEEQPATPEREAYLLDDAVPHLKACRDKHGMGAYVDASMPPMRAWPDVYVKVSEASGVGIVLCTGFYREIETGTYYVKSEQDAIWPYVREASVEELEDMCVREIVEGIHGTGVHAGAIKLGSSRATMTPAEEKAFRAGARAQKKTGVHITTHCTRLGVETSQLQLLAEEGVDLSRVVIGHTQWHIADAGYRSTTIDWMKRGANFLPTNLDLRGRPGAVFQPLVDGIHDIFDQGCGGNLVIGLDSGYCSESGPFEPMTFLPEPPWLYLYETVLPFFRTLGLTEAEETAMLAVNPQRIVPIR
jgi:phosphotriesterase-related protein